MTTQQPYLRRINAVIDHIRAHPDGDLSLAALAAVAGFSPFHFHRIFSGIVGETVHDFVQRVRLDRAAALMKDSPARATLLGMSQDDPEVTPLELCHYDLCLTAPADWQGDGAVAVRDFPACRLAALHCEGDIYRVDRAWQYLYRHWLPRSRYQPDNLPALEIFRRQPAEVGWEWYDLECAVAVVGL